MPFFLIDLLSKHFSNVLFEQTLHPRGSRYGPRTQSSLAICAGLRGLWEAGLPGEN